MSMLSRSDDAAYTENDNIKLREEIEGLKEKLDDERAKVFKRDHANGQLMAVSTEQLEEIEDLKKQLRVAKNAHDDKAMSTVDLTREIKKLKMEKTALEAQVGRLTNEAAVTWQEGIVEAMRKIAREVYDD